MEREEEEEGEDSWGRMSVMEEFMEDGGLKVGKMEEEED